MQVCNAFPHFLFCVPRALLYHEAHGCYSLMTML